MLDDKFLPGGRYVMQYFWNRNILDFQAIDRDRDDTHIEITAERAALAWYDMVRLIDKDGKEWPRNRTELVALLVSMAEAMMTMGYLIDSQTEVIKELREVIEE